ncbi:uncharacterized protein [Nicotiana tomentosiformis]|uniref:uncharacterized protein n=1 Tax=Nicotiana tomentosiformis TaxID=4098 RepID=UPI00388CA2B7
MGIVEVSGVAFTTFQLPGAAYQWRQAYEEDRPVDAKPPTWAQFSKMFLKEFIPQTLRDAWRTEFERLRQGTMKILEYTIRFNELARHAPILVPTVTERVRRFIEGLDYDLKICRVRELQTDTKRIEGVLREEMESKETKRSRSSGGFGGFYSLSMTHYGGGSNSRPAQSAHQITRGALPYSCCKHCILANKVSAQVVLNATR